MTGDFPPDILKLAESVVDRGYDEGLIDAVARVLWDEQAAQAERDAVMLTNWAERIKGNSMYPAFGLESEVAILERAVAAIRASVKP